ncbi:MAG: universal stress protein [Beijerinckiaceae bacterium]
MPKHILVATDGSALADKATVYALDLAKATGAKVTAVTVSESWSPVDIAAKVQAGQMKAVQEFEEHASKVAAKVLGHATEIAQKNGVAIETAHIADAHPAEGIVNAAEIRGCDLIAIASHGRRGISKMVMGSVAQEVMALSKIPVLVCK